MINTKRLVNALGFGCWFGHRHGMAKESTDLPILLVLINCFVDAFEFGCHSMKSTLANAFDFSFGGRKMQSA